MRLSTLAIAWFLFCGAVAGWLVGGMVPPGLRSLALHQGDFHLARPVDKPLELREAKWCKLLELYGDFDLSMEVELGEGTDLDVLVRQVEPRLVDQQLLQFQGRFSVLRMTTAHDGPAWRSRDEALVAPRGGGLSLAPGLRATVWIEARGNLVRANVAGRTTQWFRTDDVYGSTTLVVKGGKAVVYSLDVKHRGLAQAWRWSRAFWSSLGVVFALVVLAAASAFGHRPRGFVVPLMTWLIVREYDGELGFPDPAALAALLAALVALGFSYCTSWRLLLLLFGVALLVSPAQRTLQRDDPVVDALFGTKAGKQISEAYGQLVGGPRGLHDIGAAGKRVFLLGGKFLYDNSAWGEPHLEPLLESKLRTATKGPVSVPCPQTEDADVVQQWRLFSTCYTAWRPEAIVLGIAADEGGAATGNRQQTTPARLRETLAAAKAHCAQAGTKLVLFVDARHSRYGRAQGLAAPLLAEVQAAATVGVALVTAAEGDVPAAVAAKLAQTLLPLP